MQISTYSLLSVDAATASEAVRAMLDQVPAARREEALRYKSAVRQYVALKSFLMLQDIAGRPLPAWRKGEYGKPYYEAVDLGCKPFFFSVSHCSKAIAVAVSETPVGIDVEDLSRRIQPSLIEHTMSPEEQAIIGSDNVRFLEYWTRKEAFLKMLGTGIIGDMKETLSDPAADVVITTQLNEKDGYVMSIARQEPYDSRLNAKQ